ncbi:hypothetical protein ACJJTC_008819 [Scirpophaga incertulas]
MNGYRSYSSDYNNQNDGVIVYIRSDIAHSIERPTVSTSNCLLLKCGDETAVLAIYRSPSCNNINNFCCDLDPCLASLNSLKSVIVVGDLNINIAPENRDSNSNYYLDFMAFHGLMPAHVLPTRQANCLDHVFLKSERGSRIFVLDSLITDHNPLVASLDYKVKKEKSDASFVKINYPPLIQELQDTDFSDIYRATDANVAAEMLTNIVTKLTQASVVTKVPSRDPAESTNLVNKYFSEIGAKLAGDILMKCKPGAHYTPINVSDPQCDSMVLLDTDVAEVSAVINSLKNDSAPDDLILARRKAKEAEFTSDLTDGEVRQKRKIRKPVSSSDEEDDPFHYHKNS